MRRLSASGIFVLLAVVPAFAQNTTTRVSLTNVGGQGNNRSGPASVSDDGRFVVFTSDATNLVPSDTNNRADIFVRDRDLGTTHRVNLGVGGEQALGGASSNASISNDGRFVQFTSSAANLIGLDTNDQSDIFVHDRQTNTTTRVSVASNGAQAVGGPSFSGVLTPDGRHVAFVSAATNLVTGDTNARADVFVHDRQTGTTARVSLTNGGGQAGGDSLLPSLSANGQVVAFASTATNLVTGDTNGTGDIFVRDRQAGTTTRISVGPGGVQGNADSTFPTVSGDGRFVTFQSGATTLVANGSPGVYVHDRTTGVTSALSVNPGGALLAFAARISRDGHYVCYLFTESTTAANQLFVLDRQTLTKMRVDISSNGFGDELDSSGCAINVDGTLVAFDTAAPLVLEDTNGFSDVYLRTVFSTMALDKNALTFGAVTSGTTFVSQTAPQSVRLTQSGAGTVTWTATSNQPWLQVSPASGTGSTILSIGVVPAAGLPASGAATGSIFVTLAGALNALAPIVVTLRLAPNSTAMAPFGTVDTPTDNRTGVTGALPFTGWALDDIEVTRVSLCRDASDTELPPVDPNCGGAAEIFVGFAVFIDGARPDVAATFPSAPLFTRAGWGFMVLTNMLPNQGNGTYRFTMRAQDREGTWALLGTRTITCANASATLPFGTLDTPLQGDTVAGPSYVNFGWALTPLPKTIPTNGSTIRVLVDGVDVGTADYNHFRPDIQALFPGLNNSNAAVGFRILDTTAMTNGLHTIVWNVTDNQGATDGIGSRFFTVSNGSAAAITAVSAMSAADTDATALDTTPLPVRRGWDLEAPYGWFAAGAHGVTVIRSEEVNRVELQLGAGDYAGSLRTAFGLAPLPIGSRLDPATNTFTWAPGVGFVGRYDFVFVRSMDGRAVSRREVRIILHPKGRGAVGPQIVIDLPRAHASVDSPFMIGGWAVDLDAADGTGVTTLHAWAFPTSGGPPIFLGATAYGGARPDVAAVHGDRFKASGFGLIAHGLAPGEYDLALFAWSTETMGFVAPQIVRVRVMF